MARPAPRPCIAGAKPSRKPIAACSENGPRGSSVTLRHASRVRAGVSPASSRSGGSGRPPAARRSRSGAAIFPLQTGHVAVWCE